MTTQREILEAALERVKKGWVQGKWQDEDGGVCAEGAILAACTDLRVSWQIPAVLLAGNALREAAGIESIPEWNDNPTRTHDEVIEAYKTAIVESPLEEA